MAQQGFSHPLLDPLVNHLIRDSARRVVASAHLSRTELPDIEQDLRLHLWTQRDAYRPERGARSTFAKVVIRRKAAAIANRYRAKRRSGVNVSIDDYLDTRNEGDAHKGDSTIPAAKPLNVIVDSLNRRVDVSRALQRLANRDRTIAMQLMSARVTEIAEKEGIPRSTIYESIKRIRSQFIDSGLGPESHAGPDVFTVI